MTRAEHLNWCKTRALEYADQGDLASAVGSMMSDMRKHKDTDLGDAGAFLMLAGMMDAQRGDKAAVKRWIEGFN